MKRVSYKQDGVQYPNDMIKFKELMKLSDKEIFAKAKEQGIDHNETTSRFEIIKALSELRGE